MKKNFEEACLALAAVMQCTRIIDDLATSPRPETRGFGTLIGSIFTVSAEDTAACYQGKLKDLIPGLQILRDEFAGQIQRPHTYRYVFGVLHLARKIQRSRQASAQLGHALEEAQRQAATFGTDHENTLARLAQVYADHVSPLSQKIMIQGDPALLEQNRIADKIRGLLLAALRSAVLWEQLGGRRWHLLLRRKAIARQAEAWMVTLRQGHPDQ